MRLKPLETTDSEDQRVNLTFNRLFRMFFIERLILVLSQFLEPINQLVFNILFVVFYCTGVNKSFSYFPMIQLKNNWKKSLKCSTDIAGLSPEAKQNICQEC